MIAIENKAGPTYHYIARHCDIRVLASAPVARRLIITKVPAGDVTRFLPSRKRQCSDERAGWLRPLILTYALDDIPLSGVP